MGSKRKQITEKIREERKAKLRAEVFERTEGNIIYSYNSYQAYGYMVFSAAARDRGRDHSFTAYYRSLSASQRRFIIQKTILPGLAEIRLKLKDEEKKPQAGRVNPG